MRATVTWVLLADGQNAAVYANDGPGKGLERVPEFTERRAGPDSHDMMSDRAGHRFGGGTGKAGSGATLPRNDPHEFEEQRFTVDVAEKVNRAAAEKRFDRLIVAAPPRTLGHLRRALSRPAQERVMAELDKDLLKGSPSDIARHLEDHIAV